MSEVKVHYPRPPLSDGSPSTRSDIEPPVVISRDRIQIGDVSLPGLWILDHAVKVRPGYAELTRSGRTRVEPATVTVTFLVGEIDIDQDAIDHVQLQQRLAHAIDIALSEPNDGELRSSVERPSGAVSGLD